jgi:outer membrane receptor protein involved in Fe transport
LTVGDLLQALPAVTGGNVNPQVNNGGSYAGTASIGLRGLGSQRTLVLINGQRFLSGDPNAIPQNMIERIEVLTDGASSVYGSDAIAGVVNFILRSDYQGAEFSANYGISDKDDGESSGYQFTFGQSSDAHHGRHQLQPDRAGSSSHRKFSKDSVSLYGTNGGPYGGIPPQDPSAVHFAAGHIQMDAFRDIYPAHSSRAIRARAARISRPTTTATATMRPRWVRATSTTSRRST